MLLKSTFRLFVVHPSLSLRDLEHNRCHVTATVEQADFDRSILEQLDDCYDLLVLDWGLETPNARGILDVFRQQIEGQVLVHAADVPTDDPVDRGADELLVGPVSTDTIRSTIERLLLYRAYEEAMDDYFRLATERALLESELQSGLDVADQYQSVVCDLAESRQRAAEIRDELSSTAFDQAFRQLLE